MQRLVSVCWVCAPLHCACDSKAESGFVYVYPNINNPICGATISIQKEAEVAFEMQTETDSSYSHQVSAGKYTIVVSAEGYVSQTKNVELKDDGYKTFDWVMVITTV